MRQGICAIAAPPARSEWPRRPPALRRRAGASSFISISPSRPLLSLARTSGSRSGLNRPQQRTRMAIPRHRMSFSFKALGAACTSDCARVPASRADAPISGSTTSAKGARSRPPWQGPSARPPCACPPRGPPEVMEAVAHHERPSRARSQMRGEGKAHARVPASRRSRNRSRRRSRRPRDAGTSRCGRARPGGVRRHTQRVVHRGAARPAAGERHGRHHRGGSGGVSSQPRHLRGAHRRARCGAISGTISASVPAITGLSRREEAAPHVKAQRLGRPARPRIAIRQLDNDRASTRPNSPRNRTAFRPCRTG
jgi:hypothetical protein